MKIAHLCLSCFYIDGISHQENELIRQHISEGHEVLVLASTETYDENGEITYTTPSTYLGSEGCKVTRLSYRGWPALLARKLRIHPEVYDILEAFRPDSILFHGTCGWEVVTVSKYVRNNPSTKFYIDSHEDWNNSARSFISRELLHKIYYRYCLRYSLKYAISILCVSTEVMDFVKTVYKVPQSRVEFFPLGGHPVPPNEYNLRRTRARTQLGITDNEILFVQSGKQTRRKKLIESLRTFATARPKNSKLIIVGVINKDIKSEAEILIANDPNVSYLGWKDIDELTDLLCAADVYLQPGTQSITMQHSLCCHCAVILHDTPSHHFYVHDNGWLLNDIETLENVFSKINLSDLHQMMHKSYEFAVNHLDYRVLSKRVLR